MCAGVYRSLSAGACSNVWRLAVVQISEVAAGSLPRSRGSSRFGAETPGQLPSGFQDYSVPDCLPVFPGVGATVKHSRFRVDLDRLVAAHWTAASPFHDVSASFELGDDCV